MEDVAKLVNRIVVMHRGRVAMDDETREVFKRAEELEKLGLGVPQITSFMKHFKEKGNDIRDDILTVEEAKEEILSYLRRRKNA
jgi:energy-coupling factor transport system ATP-binding protein